MKTILLIITLVFFVNPIFSNEEKDSIFNSLPVAEASLIEVQGQMPDSIVTYSFDAVDDSTYLSKKIYALNSEGQAVLEEHFSWESSLNEWKISYRSEMEYDQYGNVISDIRWAYYINSFERLSKAEKRFDSNGNQELNATYLWNSTLEDWTLDKKYEYEFDGQGNLMRIVYTQLQYYDVQLLSGNKSETNYDSDGNQTLYIIYSWDTTLADWVNAYKSSSEFNDFGAEVLMEDYYWDPVNSRWNGSTKKEHEYSEDNVLISSNTYAWENTTRTWTDSKKLENSFDQNQNLVLTMNYDWIPDSASWLEKSKEVRQYENQKLTTKIVSENYNQVDTVWEPFSKELIEYNENDSVLATSDYYYNSSEQNWIGNNKTVYAYDSNGYRNLIIGYSWRSNNWVVSSKTVRQINENNMLVLSESYQWDAIVNDWKGRSKYEYEYNGNNYRTLQIDYRWDANTWDWIYSQKQVKEYPSFDYIITYSAVYKWDKTISDWVCQNISDKDYDESGLLYSEFSYYLETGYYKTDYFRNDKLNIILSIDLYRATEDEDWKVQRKRYYYYSDIGSGVENEFLTDIEIFPNPVNNQLHIQQKTLDSDISLEIYSMQGQLLKQVDINNMKTTINTDVLLPGAYVVVLSQKGVPFRNEKLLKIGL